MNRIKQCSGIHWIMQSGLINYCPSNIRAHWLCVIPFRQLELIKPQSIFNTRQLYANFSAGMFDELLWGQAASYRIPGKNWQNNWYLLGQFHFISIPTESITTLICGEILLGIDVTSYCAKKVKLWGDGHADTGRHRWTYQPINLMNTQKRERCCYKIYSKNSTH